MSNQFDHMPLAHLNALLATVVGTEEQRRQALEYLKENDPTWSEQLDKQRKLPLALVGAKLALRQVTTHPGNCEVSHN